MHLVNFFEDIANGPHSLHICGIYNSLNVGNATFVIVGSQYVTVCKQPMQVGKLSWSSLNAYLVLTLSTFLYS